MPRPKREVLATGASKALVKATRAKAGPLRDRRVGPTTLKRYHACVVRFVYFCLVWYGGFAFDWDALDIQVCEWIEHCWAEGECRAMAADTLSGVQHFLLTRRRLPGGWKLLTTWQRAELPNRAPPLPRNVVLAIAGIAWAQGRPDVAAVVLLGFHCMLRTMEFVGATVGQVALQQDFTGVLALPWTKTSQVRGAQELVLIEDPAVGMRLAIAIYKRAPHEPILQMSVQQFRVWFAACLSHLLLDLFFFRLYSIRRGGATHDFQVHCDVQRTLFRGRWSQVSVAKIYVTEGLAMLTQMQMSADALERIEYYIGQLDRPLAN